MDLWRQLNAPFCERKRVIPRRVRRLLQQHHYFKEEENCFPYYVIADIGQKQKVFSYLQDENAVETTWCFYVTWCLIFVKVHYDLLLRLMISECLWWKCFLRFDELLHRCPQCSQQKGLSLVWILLWTLRDDVKLDRNVHWSHKYGFSLVCMRLCLFRFEEIFVVYPQPADWHLYIEIAVWHDKCLCRLLDFRHLKKRSNYSLKQLKQQQKTT